MSSLISLDLQTLRALTEHPETGALMRELSQDELAKATIDVRDFDEGGKHTVRVNGEPFFSFELWLGRIDSVKRLREKRPEPQPERKKWEYFTAYGHEASLDAWGEEGWELVSCVQPVDADVRMYFKREKK